MEKWSGKVCVVTGASAGIGKSIVEALAKAGLTVIGLARRSEKIEENSKQIGEASGRVHALKCDVSDLNSVKEAFRLIEKQFGSINILVNNAGVAHSIRILDESDEVTQLINSTININFTGLVHCTREAVRLIKKSDDFGMIININDICGHSLPYPGEESINVYAPTKHALTAFVEVVRRELVVEENEKIRVSCINPGTTKTQDNLDPGDFFAGVGDYFSITPHLQPEDIANGVLVLLRTPYSVNITQLTIRPVGEKL